ncbi:MAG: glycosyltransferase family 4 protein [Chitinivorax sp.]
MQGPPDVALAGRMAGDEVRCQMGRASALVLPSICYESMPMTVLEAYASGLPVIASRLAHCLIWWKRAKPACCLLPGDAADLAAKLRWAGEHPEAMLEMGRNARLKYEAGFTPASNYQQLMTIYEEAIQAMQGKRSRITRVQSDPSGYWRTNRCAGRNEAIGCILTGAGKTNPAMSVSACTFGGDCTPDGEFGRVVVEAGRQRRMACWSPGCCGCWGEKGQQRYQRPGFDGNIASWRHRAARAGVFLRQHRRYAGLLKSAPESSSAFKSAVCIRRHSVLCPRLRISRLSR